MPGFAITVSGNEALTRRLLELGRDAPRAATRAVNRTLATIKTATVRALVQDLGLRNKDVDPSIKTERARFSRQLATLWVTGRRIPLFAFGARQTRAGVTYRFPSGRGFVPGAFVATMRSGHVGVFARRLASGVAGPAGARVRRLPIVELHGPSLPGAMVRSGIAAAMQARAQEVLEANLEHEIAYMLSERTPAADE